MGLKMKLDIRLEDGNPIIFFPEETDHKKMIACYTRKEEHSAAQRAYMRSLPKPVSQADYRRVWDLLAHYSVVALTALRQ